MNNILTNDDNFIILLKNNNDDYIQLLSVNHYDLPCQILTAASMATLVPWQHWFFNALYIMHISSHDNIGSQGVRQLTVIE